MFDLLLDWDRPAHGSPTAQTMFLRIRLVPQAAASERVPVNVALVVDASSSMNEGDKLANAKTACIEVAKQLKTDDRLWLATFAGDVTELLSGGRGDAAGLASTESAVNQMAASGVTRVDLALDWLRETLGRTDGGVNLGFLVTDGHATDPSGTKLKDFSDLLASAQNVGGAGTQICCIGLGDAASFDSAFLLNLAESGRGQFLYAASPVELGDLLRVRMGSSQRNAAQSATVRINLLRAQDSVEGLCRHSQDYLPLDPVAGVDLDIGPLAVDEPTDVLVRLRVHPKPRLEPEGVEDIVRVTCSAGKAKGIERTANVQFTKSLKKAQTMNREVDDAKNLWLMRMYKRESLVTDDPNRTGDLLGHIIVIAEKLGDSESAKQAKANLDELEKTGKLTANSRTMILGAGEGPGADKR